MLPADKRDVLNGFLGQLPEHVAARLAKAIEVDRLIGGIDLPHQELLQALRPQLRQAAAPSRMSTPQRLFCQPFEDLLVDGMPQTKQKGRIARESIAPIWHWLATELIPDKHQALTDDIRAAIVKNRSGDIRAKVEELWDISAGAIRSALATEKKAADAARMLGSHVVADDAAEIASLISQGTDLVALQEKLPRPVLTLGEGEIAILRDAYDRYSETQPDLAPYIVLMVMGRLSRPWEALHLAGVLSGQSTDTILSNTDMGIVGELLFSDLDSYVAKISAARPRDFNPAELVEALGAFAELSSGMVKELGIRRDGKWGQHLTKARASVAAIMDDLAGRAPKEILAALPQPKFGSFGRGPKPRDLSRPPDPEKVAKAMRYATLIGHAKPFAVAAAFNAKLSEAVDEIAAALRLFAEEILREARAPNRGPHTDAHLNLVLDLCALILGEEETAFLRRRARASLQAAS